MPPTGTAYDVDWIFSNVSNCHVATNRDWFVSFTDFKSYTHDVHFGGAAEVQGVGDVHLNVKTHSTDGSYKTLVLHDVLYIPGMVCNLLGKPVIATHNPVIYYGRRYGQLINRQTGELDGILDGSKVFDKLWLTGQPWGKTSLSPDLGYVINAHWPEEEQAKWQAHKASTVDSSEKVYMGGPPYTAEEKSWLKTHHGGEYKFLLCYGLSIYKEESREEGRSIARALMEDHDDDPCPHCGT